MHTTFFCSSWINKKMRLPRKTIAKYSVTFFDNNFSLHKTKWEPKLFPLWQSSDYYKICLRILVRTKTFSRQTKRVLFRWRDYTQIKLHGREGGTTVAPDVRRGPVRTTNGLQRNVDKNVNVRFFWYLSH